MHRLVVAVLLGACVAERSDSRPSTQTSALQEIDSAGVRMVFNASPVSPGAALTVGASPTVEIGKKDGEAAYLFDQIVSVRRLSDGRILVLEGGGRTRELRLFSPDGKHITTFGRRGQGPGEFTTAPEIVILPGDTILAWDRNGARYSWFLPDGKLVRERKYALEGSRSLHVPSAIAAQWTLLPDGSLFVDDQMEPPLGPRVPTGENSFTQGVAEDIVLNDRARIGFIIDSGMKSISLGDSLPRLQTISKGDEMVSNGFYPWSRFAAEGNPTRAHVTTAGVWEVRTFGVDGALTRVVRLGAPRRPLTRELIAADLDDEKRNSKNPALVEELFNRLPRPDSVPPIYDITVDRAGRIWLTENPPATPPLYQVIDKNGRWLGAVQGHADWGYIAEIGEDYIITIWRDANDLQHVRMYQLAS